ncbi:beta-1,6-N-acetylglucosaminyltransferase [Niabella sp. 22666]|uniref:beta-1,6-N-acetylglucosaminyltransferase n=1 Tax=Niabella sp. 22666 TaxID=3453954 RepID=UPI003F836567
MQLCNLILAHKNPQQTARLLESLYHPDCTTYLHVDKKFSLEPFKKVIKDLSRVRFIRKRTSVHWGGPSMVYAIAKAILEIQADRQQYDYINLISAQDFPIKPIHEFVDFLTKNNDKQFISYLEGEEADVWWTSAAARFQNYHFNELQVNHKYLAQGWINKLLPKRKVPFEWDLVGGNCATWWTLKLDCAVYMAQKILEDKQVKSFIKLTWGIDEIIFPTLVMNSPFRSITINNNLRYIDWEEQNAHPKILQMEDYDRLIGSGHFFARKFDESVDSQVLDRLQQTFSILSK